MYIHKKKEAGFTKSPNSGSNGPRKRNSILTALNQKFLGLIPGMLCKFCDTSVVFKSLMSGAVGVTVDFKARLHQASASTQSQRCDDV